MIKALYIFVMFQKGLKICFALETFKFLPNNYIIKS